MLIHLCNGGLGNRLRPILSMIAAQDLKDVVTPIFHLWLNNTSCGCDIGDILELPDNFEIPDGYTFISHLPLSNTTLDKYINSNCITIPEMVKKAGEYKVYSGKTLAPIAKEAATGKDVMFSSCFWYNCPMYKIPETFSKIIKPDIAEKIISIAKELCLDKSVIGCHLRCTDICSPDILKKVNDIEQVIDSAPRTKYFICSDQEDISQTFEKFPNVIMYRKQSFVKKSQPFTTWARGNFDRDKDSIVEAVIEMGLLSMCFLQHGLHTSRESTFLDVAKVISGWAASSPSPRRTP